MLLIARIGVAVMVFGLVASCLHRHAVPAGNPTAAWPHVPKGRIAWSADGNHNDEDDWAASPIALAIFARFGVKDRLVHFDYNSILAENDPRFAREHEISVLGAAERFGYPRAVFHDSRRNLEASVESIRKAIDASTADDPLYFVVAGPMQLAYMGIQKSDPAKRKHVTVISHSRWNDGFAADTRFTHTKRDVIPSGIKWVQIFDQNRYLATSPYGRPATDEEWRPWNWMRDSRDPDVRWLWERTRATTRADASDAGMAYFLMAGDEHVDLHKLERLLDDKVQPLALGPRRRIRIEAENFVVLDRYQVEHRNDREASHRIDVRLDAAAGRIRTRYDEPHAPASGRFDVAVRYRDEVGGRSRFTFLVNGAPKGEPWAAARDDGRWRSHVIPAIELRAGDEVTVAVERDGKEPARLDYVELVHTGAPTSRLDDDHALPGQVIVKAGNPGHLRYNGGGPVFLSGPDNPEDFLFRGTPNLDGTRSRGGQEQMIEALARSGVNAFHVQLFRMKRCNYKNEGDDTHTPFIDHDPSRPLNQALLAQWDGWIGLLEQAGINVMVELYNDATDVERMGWKLDGRGQLHPDERSLVEGVVVRLKEHKNILWSIEESANKLPRERTAHFRAIAELIARTDDRNHPIIQSFVVPNDPEGDFHEGAALSDAYLGDPNIDAVTWLHVVPHGDDLEAQHREYLRYHELSARDFIVLKNETYHHPRSGALSRRYMWSAAMARLHTFEAYHHADKGTPETLADDGRIRKFMEETDFFRMQPSDALAAGATRWVLAQPGQSYIAYTYDASGALGIRDMVDGTYDLRWFDAVTGRSATKAGVAVAAGTGTFRKPEGFGDEVALYLRRGAGPTAFRYTEWSDGRYGAELYDYQTDPGERRNVARHPRQAPTVARPRTRLPESERQSGPAALGP